MENCFRQTLSKDAVMKKILSTVLGVVITCSMTACGQSSNTGADENGAGVGAGIETGSNAGADVDKEPEYVYVPEYIELEDDLGDNGFIGNLTLNGNSLYYNQYRYDVETETAIQAIYEYSLREDTLKEIPIEIPSESCMITGFAVDESGNLYVLINDYGSEQADAVAATRPDTFLYKYDGQSAVVMEKDITSILAGYGANSYISDIAADQQGNIYLSINDEIILLSAEGEERGSVKTGGAGVSSFGVGKNGNVYFTQGGTVLFEVDFKSKEITNSYSDIPGISGDGFGVGITKDFLINDGISVYEYDLESQSFEKILTWSDCDINGSNVRYVGALENGNLAAIVYDRDTGVTELVKLVKTDSAQVTEKEEVVIAVLRESQELQEAVVAFNKSGEKYHVTIKSYIDSNDWDSDGFTAAMTNLNNDIVSATNCPDILDLSTIDEQIYAEKGLFEDLYPYLEQSSVLNKDDFFQNILECYTYDGKLLSIPATFYIDTVVGKSSVVGEEMGWSLEEMLACAKGYPEAVVFDAEQKSSILYSCLLYNQDTFIDWEIGKCYFDSEEFKTLLEFANLLPDETEGYSIGSEDVEGLQTEEVLLERVYVSSVNHIQLEQAKFGEDVTFIGFPTVDGSVGCGVYSGPRYGITVKAQNKNGAWAFIESYLSNAGQEQYNWSLPTNQNQFEEMVYKQMNPEYVLDDTGNPILDDNGEPATTAGVATTWVGDWEYTYHTPTPEEVEKLRKLIETASPVDTLDTEILSIVLEESAVYFSGEKSVDEVADIIQNRVQIYISENS